MYPKYPNTNYLGHRGKTDDWPMMSRPKDVLKDCLSVTKTFHKGFLPNQHSISLTKHQIYFQSLITVKPDLMYKQRLFRKI